MATCADKCQMETSGGEDCPVSSTIFYVNSCYYELCVYMLSAFTYIIIVQCQTRFDLLFSIIMNCVTYSVLYENLTCSISTRLNSPGKTWKMDIGHDWS